MSLLDGILGQLGNVVNIDELAGKIGMSADELKQGGESLFAKLSSGESPVAAVQSAAAETGVDASKLQELLPTLAEKFGVDGQDGLLAKLTGEGGMLSSVTGFLDRDGDGNPINDVTDMIGGFFKK
jgi:hypothetical protein